MKRAQLQTVSIPQGRPMCEALDGDHCCPEAARYRVSNEWKAHLAPLVLAYDLCARHADAMISTNRAADLRCEELP